jgi:hypothetical protein
MPNSWIRIGVPRKNERYKAQPLLINGLRERHPNAINKPAGTAIEKALTLRKMVIATPSNRDS